MEGAILRKILLSEHPKIRASRLLLAFKFLKREKVASFSSYSWQVTLSRRERERERERERWWEEEAVAGREERERIFHNSSLAQTSRHPESLLLQWERRVFQSPRHYLASEHHRHHESWKYKAATPLSLRISAPIQSQRLTCLDFLSVF